MQKLQLAIFGNVRLNYQDDIINDIKRICLDYYQQIEIIWDVFCDKLAEFVSDDGTEVNIPKDRFLADDEFRTFASSTGWHKGIHS